LYDYIYAGAPGSTNATFLNGMSFVEGWEQNLYISKWSMHQLVYISYLSSWFVLWICLSTLWAIYPSLPFSNGHCPKCG